LAYATFNGDLFNSACRASVLCHRRRVITVRGGLADLIH